MVTLLYDCSLIVTSNSKQCTNIFSTFDFFKVFVYIHVDESKDPRLLRSINKSMNPVLAKHEVHLNCAHEI